MNFITKSLKKIFSKNISNNANSTQATTSLNNKLFVEGLLTIASSSVKSFCDFRLPDQDCVNVLELGVTNLKRHKLKMTFSGGVIVVFGKARPG